MLGRVVHSVPSSLQLQRFPLQLLRLSGARHGPPALLRRLACLSEMTDANSSKPFLYQTPVLHPELQAMLDKEFTILRHSDVDRHREQVDAIFTFLSPPVTREVVESLPNLKVVGSCSVGYDHVDLRACAERGVRVGYTPGVLNDSTADMAWALLLAAGRRVVEGDALAKSPHTTGPKFDNNWFGFQVSNMTLGIIGMGRIGMEVAKRAHGFNMRVLYHNRNRRTQEEEEQCCASYVPDMSDLLGQSDYVVLVAPATKDTYKMMGKERFGQMKRTGVFVNITRGTLVDQEALVDALQGGTIAAAGLDVTDPEPLPRDHPLLTLPNVTITPHTGSATLYTRRKMVQMTIDNIKAALRGSAMLNEVVLPKTTH